MTTDEKNQGSDLLFDHPAPKPKNIWYFATNQLNLMYMLAAGLIMPPKAFGKKYYEDCLNFIPGWIPFFAGAVPKKLVEMGLKETQVLRPVVVAMNLSLLKGSARGISTNGKIRDILLPDELTDAHDVICIPAPLPTAFIESISFLSREDKTSCEKDAREYGNVPLDTFKRGIDKRLSGKPGFIGGWNQQKHFSDHSNVSMDTFLAVGGITAMLLNFGNMSNLATLACQTAFDGPSVANTSLWEDSVIQGLEEWISTGAAQTSGNGLNSLYWEVLNQIILAGMDPDTHAAYEDEILNLLSRRKDASDLESREMLSNLVTDLSALIQFGEKNATELFTSHTGEFERALILFFLRDRCADLIEFNHPLLTERDYLAAALLFSAREKWIGLPLSLRDQPGLDHAVSFRMAAMAHRLLKTGIDLGPLPPRCKPLRELLLPEGAKGWNRNQADAALSLARDMNWDCISTRIRLGKGEYALTVESGGITIVLPGEVRAVETDVDIAKFFALMAEKRVIEIKSESKARKILI